MLSLNKKISLFKRKSRRIQLTLADKYQLIKVKDDTLYIISRGLTRDDIEEFSILRDEDDCDKIVPSRTYAVSDSNMSRIFGR